MNEKLGRHARPGSYTFAQEGTRATTTLQKWHSRGQNCHTFRGLESSVRIETTLYKLKNTGMGANKKDKERHRREDTSCIWEENEKNNTEECRLSSATVASGHSSSELAHRHPAMSKPERHELRVARPCLGMNVRSRSSPKNACPLPRRN